MITYACPSCRKTLQAQDNQVGTMVKCPQCQGQVQVPLAGAQDDSSNVVLWVLLAVGGGLFLLFMLACVVFAAFTLIGTNSSTTFSKVGTAIATSGR